MARIPLGGLLGVLLTAAAAVVLFGSVRWRARTRDLRAELAASAAGAAPKTFDARELEDLPAPVRRYFHVALHAGQQVVESARLATEGEFLMDAQKKSWARFTADQAPSPELARGELLRWLAGGLVTSVFAPDRPRTVGASNVPTPWEGTWTAYSPRNGMHVPSAGEVSWVLPEGGSLTGAAV